jgi:hypothetical protein
VKWLALLVLVAGCLAACHRARTPNVIDGAVPPGLVECTGRPLAPTPSSDGWDHWQSKVTDALGDPRHVAQDVIAPPGAPVAVTARFAYGLVWKDLEHETVEAYVDDCTGWLDLGPATTDHDGRVTVQVGPALTAGTHEIRFVVRGDGSQAAATLWILPTGTHVVVTDLDGTMTSDDAELYQSILDGDHVPLAYPGAAALTRAHAAAGEVVIYLTGRPYWLLARTRRWLDDLDFAAGPIHVTDSNEDSLATDEHVGAFKLAWLTALIGAGYVVDVVYGNATTDVFAYLGAGLSADRVYIIGKHAGADGTQAVQDSWLPRVDVVKKMPLLDPAGRRTPR